VDGGAEGENGEVMENGRWKMEKGTEGVGKKGKRED
jgi:hypothetical protein